MTGTTRGYRIFQKGLFIIGILILVVAAGFAIYSWQHQKVTKLNAKVGQLTTQVAGFDDQVASLSRKLNTACSQNLPAPAACASYTYTSTKGVTVLVYTPPKNSTISSPLVVLGEVPGGWSFEAQFPMQLKDSKGNVIAQASAKVLGNWQTSHLVPFSVQLTYTKPETGSGTIVLKRDNPSGLAKNDDSVSIPINF